MSSCVPKIMIMMYGSWDMEHDGQNSLSFCAIFAFYPINNPKNQNFENKKKTLEISPFYIYEPQMMIIDVWFLRYWGRRTKFLVIFDHFFPFYRTNNPKKKKKGLEMSLYTFLPQIMITWCTVSEILCAIDGRTEGKSDI